jgi:hypothetical protein
LVVQGSAEGIFNQEDKDLIISQLKKYLTEVVPPTGENLFDGLFLARCRLNIHLILNISPKGPILK